MESSEASRKGTLRKVEVGTRSAASPWNRAFALAYSTLLLGMSSLVIVDGLFNYATGGLLLFEGISPVFKIWVAIILLLLSASSLGSAAISRDK